MERDVDYFVFLSIFNLGVEKRNRAVFSFSSSLYFSPPCGFFFPFSPLKLLRGDSTVHSILSQADGSATSTRLLLLWGRSQPGSGYRPLMTFVLLMPSFHCDGPTSFPAHDWCGQGKKKRMTADQRCRCFIVTGPCTAITRVTFFSPLHFIDWSWHVYCLICFAFFVYH